MSHSQRPEGDQRQGGASPEAICIVQRGNLWLAHHEVESFREALDNLESLVSLYRIGAITNGNADVHPIGIEHRFDFVVRSERAGASEPHSDIFRHALDHPRVPAAQVLHLGGDPEGDVRGAAAVGMRTAWVNAMPLARPGPARVPCLTRPSGAWMNWRRRSRRCGGRQMGDDVNCQDSAGLGDYDPGWPSVRYSAFASASPGRALRTARSRRRTRR